MDIREIQKILEKHRATMTAQKVHGLWVVVLTRAPHVELSRAHAEKLKDALQLALLPLDVDLNKVVE